MSITSILPAHLFKLGIRDIFIHRKRLLILEHERGKNEGSPGEVFFGGISLEGRGFLGTLEPTFTAFVRFYVFIGF